jgi:hypothetical protein
MKRTALTQRDQRNQRTESVLVPLVPLCETMLFPECRINQPKRYEDEMSFQRMRTFTESDVEPGTGRCVASDQ